MQPAKQDSTWLHWPDEGVNGSAMRDKQQLGKSSDTSGGSELRWEGIQVNSTGVPWAWIDTLYTNIMRLCY